MRTFHLIWALLLPLAAAMPLQAQKLTSSGSDKPISSVELDSRNIRSTAVRSNSAGIRLSTDNYVIEDGSAQRRRGIIGTMPIADNANIGIGLYKVSRYSSKEPDLKKLMPMEDLDGRKQRIAAIGLSVRF